VRIAEVPSPNHDARAGAPDMIVLHYTGMPSAAAALARMTDPGAKVSAHWMIDEDGGLVRLVPEERRAWHAGAAFWRGVRDINGVSVGIELVNPGHEFGYRPFPAPQVAALVGLLGEIRSRWIISDARILGHSDVAPRRKEDPGELFPWEGLAKDGHGLWPRARPAPGPPLKAGEEGAAVLALQSGLARLGYDLTASGRYDEATLAVVRAFQRHWAPARIDGLADGQARASLLALLKISP
jgi:N-acetylmuramoyl-L-alanine amidase